MTSANYCYRGVNIHIEYSLGTKGNVVLLHGWGASVQAMSGIFAHLSRNGFSVYSIDFPGFGQSDLPGVDWGTFDYADAVQAFLCDNNIILPLIIGHSFGGRVAIILGARKVAKGLILTSAAGIKPRFSIKKRCKILLYKLHKSKNAGSEDYRALPDSMKGVFVRVVNTHLETYMKRINVPALLIWGDGDNETPLYMAKRMNKLIRQSGLAVIGGCGHFVFADNPMAFYKATDTFTDVIFGG